MNGSIVVLVLALLLVQCSSLEVDPNRNQNPYPDAKATSNITVIGTVFCDACCDSTFSNHSYFISGAQVRINCNFKANSASRDEITITTDKTTDQYGIYKLDIPPIDGFQCKVGKEIESFCRASLIGSSPSALCNIPAVTASAQHISVREPQTDACIYNLNALYYRPEKNVTICTSQKDTKQDEALNNSLFFWPPWYHWPWEHSPSFPFPFPSPPSFPFPLPFFTPPPPFWENIPPVPFFTPPPPFWEKFPPIPFFTPPPPPPFWYIPPIPFLTPPPSPPPPSFPFPFPFPPWGKDKTPLPPPPPSLPFPFPPWPPIFTPSSPPPPPPSPPPPYFPFPHFPPFPPFSPTPDTPTPPPVR